MKIGSYFVFAVCALFNSCVFSDAQVVWLSTRNMDFTDCDREERQVKEFAGIRNTCPFDVIYEQSDEQYVIVEGDEEYFGRLHTDVSKGVLEVSVESGRYRNVRLRVKVGSPDINYISMSGSGSIICKTDIEADGELTLRVSGSGDISAENIGCDILESSVSGSGEIKVSYIDADKVNVSVTGSGDWDADEIESEYLNIVVSGSGDVEIAEVDIDGSLNATVKGSGDIDVSGYASNVVASVSGSGDISGRLKYDNITKSRSGSGDIDW